MSELGRLATEIVDDELPYLETGERLVEISRASGWLTNNVGKLNTLIYTSYSGENPGMLLEESNIYKNIYLYDYYKRKAGSVLKNMDSSVLQWLTLKEGDSQITLQNKNEVAKTYMSISKQNKEDLDKLVWQYNLYQSYPRGIDLSYDEVCISSGSVNIYEGDFSINGFVEIASGQSQIAIPLNMTETPKNISLSLIKPSDSAPNTSFSVVGTSVSVTGFIVDLGSTINQPGYSISYGVK